MFGRRVDEGQRDDRPLLAFQLGANHLKSQITELTKRSLLSLYKLWLAKVPHRLTHQL